jgi:hypothetical protein
MVTTSAPQAPLSPHWAFVGQLREGTTLTPCRGESNTLFQTHPSLSSDSSRDGDLGLMAGRLPCTACRPDEAARVPLPSQARKRRVT